MHTYMYACLYRQLTDKVTSVCQVKEDRHIRCVTGSLIDVLSMEQLCCLMLLTTIVHC